MFEIALKRIEEELRDMQKNPTGSCTAGPMGDDLFNWEAEIKGPEDSPYAGGAFRLSIFFTLSYPLEPPVVSFLTQVYHPNIDRHGTICVDILGERWNPAITVSSVLLSICSLLKDPNPGDPLVLEVANVYENNRAKYEETARAWTRRYAMPAAAQTDQ